MNLIRITTLTLLTAAMALAGPALAGASPSEDLAKDSRLGRNGLLDQTWNANSANADKRKTAVACDLGEWREDASSAQKFYAKALECLNKNWKPVIEAAGHKFEPAKVDVAATGDGGGPCIKNDGDRKRNYSSYYCTENQTIYLPFSQRLTKCDKTEHCNVSGGKSINEISLQYGRHVQQRTGILDAVNERNKDVKSDEGKDISRRMVLQRQGFAGASVGALTNSGASSSSDLDKKRFREAKEDMKAGRLVGTAETVGSKSNTYHWWLLGTSTTKLDKVNTWTAAKNVDGKETK